MGKDKGGHVAALKSNSGKHHRSPSGAGHQTKANERDTITEVHRDFKQQIKKWQFNDMSFFDDAITGLPNEKRENSSIQEAAKDFAKEIIKQLASARRNQKPHQDQEQTKSIRAAKEIFQKVLSSKGEDHCAYIDAKTFCTAITDRFNEAVDEALTALQPKKHEGKHTRNAAKRTQSTTYLS